MKLPSIQTLWHGTTKVFMRFPIQVLLAIFSVGIWWYLIETNFREAQLSTQLATILAVCNLALTLSLASDLFAEVHQYSSPKKWTLRVLVLLISIGLYFILNPWLHEVDIFRVLLLVFAFHLLVAFAPFIGKSSLNGFWQYNKTLFLRFLTSAFYGAVLYGGLAVAIMAIDGLFNVHLDYHWYMKLFAIVSAGFVTIFFLAGVPSDFSALEQDESYPKGLKVFTQYVLLPLASIYLVILLVYEAKIIVIWTLPKGLVSTLILGYAIFGILSLLLIYPVKDKEGNGWMKFFSKFFYLMMIPLVLLLLLAVWKRVSSYGITESRYILMILAVWLAGITVYFLLSKKQNIKIIPISLFILTLLSTFGPQSAFSVAKYSQLARLKKLMESKKETEVNEQAEVLKYLVDRHGLTAIQALTKVDMEAIETKIDVKGKKDSVSKYEINSQKLDTAFAILKVKNMDNIYDLDMAYFKNENEGLIDIDGYDAFIDLYENDNDSLKKYDGTTFAITRSRSLESSNEYKFTLTIGKDEKLIFDLKDVIANAQEQYKVDTIVTKNNNYVRTYMMPKEVMKITKQAKKYTLTYIVNKFNGALNNDSKVLNVYDFEGYLLIKKN